MTNRLEHERGFTLVEVLVAVLLLSMLAVGAAALGAAAARAVLVARTASSTAALARQKHEQIRALTWAVNEAGSLMTDTTADFQSQVRRPAVAAPRYRRPARSTPTSPATPTTSTLKAAGPESGASPPPAAAFARRWSVDRLDGSQDATLVVRVLVLPIAWASHRAGHGAAAMLVSEATLVSMRTRTAR